jgi:hypothetical protein
MQKLTILTLTGLVLTGGITSAQTENPATSRTSQNAPAAAYEEIEIFRRILDRALQNNLVKFHVPKSIEAVAFSPDGKLLASSTADMVRFWDATSDKLLSDITGIRDHVHGTLQLHGPEGFCLQNFGVVYSVTLPWDHQSPFGESAKTEAKALSEWDRVRKELRGEKVEAEKKTSPATPSLTDTILKVMAENGGKFSQLRDNEQLTVVVTLRSGHTCNNCHAATSSVSPNLHGSADEKLLLLFDVGKDEPVRDTAEKALIETGTQRVKKEFEIGRVGVEATNFANLGDQRLKQGREKEAIDSYEKAIETLRQIAQAKRHAGASTKDLQGERDLISDLFTKQARAYLALGEADKAYNLLQKIARDNTRAQGKKIIPDETPPRVSLPGKLTISAPKQMLQQVGSGKMTFEDFKKGTRVEYFPLAEPHSSQAPLSGDKKGEGAQTEGAEKKKP